MEERRDEELKEWSGTRHEMIDNNISVQNKRQAAEGHSFDLHRVHCIIRYIYVVEDSSYYRGQAGRQAGRQSS